MTSSVFQICVLVLFPVFVSGQTNNLTGSPYSLFGLGVETNSNIGKNSSLGNGGYALSGDGFINNLNPASYGSLGKSSFLFDFGFLAELSSISDRSSEEKRMAGSFSNLALASSITPNSAFGISVLPVSDVGYSLLGIESNVEGSLQPFRSNIFGSGALNDLKFSYGHSVSKNFRVGANVSFLFGSIEEREQINAGASSLTILEKNRYNGFRLGVGSQYELNEKLSFGFVLDLPTSLSGSRDRSVQKTLDMGKAPVENESNVAISNFDLPMEINHGLLFKPKDNLSFNLDYGLKLWNVTGQKDNVGEYVDQNSFSAGAEYFVDEHGIKFWQRIRFRVGFNYDTGYLKVNENNIDMYRFTAGLGIPLGYRTQSKLNISFGSGRRGSAEGILVEERFNTFNINLSLKDIWFLKRQIN